MADSFTDAEIEAVRLSAMPDMANANLGSNLHFHCGSSFMAASDSPLDLMSTTCIPLQVVS